MNRHSLWIMVVVLSLLLLGVKFFIESTEEAKAQTVCVPTAPPVSIEVEAHVLECQGNCRNKGTPNGICVAQSGAEWKALSVDCECVELPANTSGFTPRSMNDTLDWCCDTGGEDLIVFCYR